MTMKTLIILLTISCLTFMTAIVTSLYGGGPIASSLAIAGLFGFILSITLYIRTKK